MDIQTLSLAGLAAIGAVNVITMFKSGIPSQVKFIISLVVAFGILWIPQEFSNIILEKVREAITIAFASSGLYKLTQNAGNS